jgi:type IV pilus assembly protein PilY1
MKTVSRVFLSLLYVVWLPFIASAATCDQYPGDTWIYGGITSTIKPNVLIIIDTSGSMKDTVPGSVADYAPATTYATTKVCYETNNQSATDCSASKIYKQVISNNKTKWVYDGYVLTNVATSCNNANPKTLLSTTGQYTGRSLKTSNSPGACATSGSDVYATGNWVNWGASPPAAVKKIDIARTVVNSLIASTTGINLGVMIFHSGGGGTFFNNTVSGATYTTTVKDMDAIHTGSTTNRDALIASINSTTVTASFAGTPLGESLYEAGKYFGGQSSAFKSTVGLSGSPLQYTTPITASCQKNFIIFITDGMASQDTDAVLKTICTNGDCDGDGVEPKDLNHSMDDVAKYLRDYDLLTDNAATGKEYTIGKQYVTTYTIGFGLSGADAAAVTLLNRAADSSHGKGAAYLSGDQSGLTDAFSQILYGILSVDTSFVAPVVPISPDNKTYGSNRIYMGFFKPQNQTAWLGNLKKYGLDTNNNIIDKNGASPFTTTSYSYWNNSGTPDATSVDLGGAGGVLLSRSTARSIYTYTGSNTSLTDSSNLFSTTNSAITSTGADTGTTRTLNVTDDTKKNDLINFVHGYDVYSKGSGTTIKRGWLFGDVLHSKPLVVNYATYTSSTTNESSCSTNKSIIYVGSNDGMLHAINDCDGSEAWAFIPPEILSNLQEIPGAIHSYAVDSSPSVYIYDANKNGNIETSTDKVLLMIGLRRGGGPNNYSGVPAKGSYYALDVSNPAAPRYLWSISNATSGFSELGESWGEPKIVKMKIGTASKMVAFIPGGYDNLNEDSRYGATQNFTGTGTVDNSASGAGNLISTPITPVVGPYSPKGRGVYAVEVATLSSAGVPTITSTPTRIWGAAYGSSTNYTTAPATDAGMTFSIVSDITTLDVDGNGYIDRLYATDLGGNLWRFDVGDTSIASWKGNKIFSANPASGADTGRKFFFKPIATLETPVTVSTRGNDALVFIGSGDREHPTNTSVVDRIYAVRDKGQTSAKTETDLTDVTSNALQSATATATEVKNLLTDLSSSYGWYIKLNQNTGEKALANPTLANKIVYFTTFTPGASVNTDPCRPSNLGTSRLYVLNYSTGEAVMNYDTSNDGTVSSASNKRAISGTTLLQKSDRVQTLGSGIASGVVIVGDKALVGAEGEILPLETKKGSSGSSGGRIINLYWGQK